MKLFALTLGSLVAIGKMVFALDEELLREMEASAVELGFSEAKLEATIEQLLAGGVRDRRLQGSCSLTYSGSIPESGEVTASIPCDSGWWRPYKWDWWTVNLQAGTTYIIRADRLHCALDTAMVLYQGISPGANLCNVDPYNNIAGLTIRGTSDDAYQPVNCNGVPFTVGRDPRIFFTPSWTGMYTLAVFNFYSNALGFCAANRYGDFGYKITVNPPPRTPQPTLQPTISPSTLKPTLQPTISPSTLQPTVSPSTLQPTISPSTLQPTISPSTLKPTTRPSTLKPTLRPQTPKPTTRPSTIKPTSRPSTARPSTAPPTTLPPTAPPNTLPTNLPTLPPTAPPNTLPTNLPTLATDRTSPLPNLCGEVCGDPHMKLFNGEYYDFHGQCDLVLINAPDFANGLGLDIHIRTMLRHEYSFVESAAVRIGDDILEVSSWGAYALNGVTSADLSGAHLGTYTVAYTVENKKKSVFLIQDGAEGHIEVSTFKDWVSVKVFATEEDFGTSSGLMGEYPTGRMMARNKTTVFTKAEANEFGNEWQVTPDEPKLFMFEDREPQSKDGVKCIMPTSTATHRRLGENIAEEAAKEVCAKYGEQVDRFEMCVFDTMASGDLEMAMSGVY